MNFLYELYETIKNIEFSEVYETIYPYICLICNYTFNYCPIYYQMMYFYFPILYFYLRWKRFRKVKMSDYGVYNLENPTNRYYVKIELFILNVFNFVVLMECFFTLSSKFLLTLKVMLYKKYGSHAYVFARWVKINHFWLTWKPIFKKVSYFGLFSYIRTKWYKNK